MDEALPSGRGYKRRHSSVDDRSGRHHSGGSRGSSWQESPPRPKRYKRPPRTCRHPGCGGIYICFKYSPYGFGFCRNKRCPGMADLKSQCRHNGFVSPEAAEANHRRALQQRDDRQARLAAEAERQREEEERRRKRRDEAEARQFMEEQENDRRRQAHVPPPWLKKAAPEPLQVAQYYVAPKRMPKAMRQQLARASGSSSSAVAPPAPQVRVTPVRPKAKPKARPKQRVAPALMKEVYTLRQQLHQRAREVFGYRNQLRQSHQRTLSMEQAAAAAQRQVQETSAALKDATALLQAESAMVIAANGRRRLRRGAGAPSSSPPRAKPQPPSSSERSLRRRGSDSTSTPVKDRR